jgi:hypothetical protein
LPFWKVLAKFDKSFLILFFFISFNSGLAMMPQTVIFYQFKNDYGLEASDVNAYVAIASIPYSLKIIYGIMVDTLRIGKSRYKSFIFIYSIF